MSPENKLIDWLIDVADSEAVTLKSAQELAREIGNFSPKLEKVICELSFWMIIHYLISWKFTTKGFGFPARRGEGREGAREEGGRRGQGGTGAEGGGTERGNDGGDGQNQGDFQGKTNTQALSVTVTPVWVTIRLQWEFFGPKKDLHIMQIIG